MHYFAHTVIEHGDTRYPAGSPVPADLPGLDELLEHGAVSTERYTRKVIVDADGVIIDPLAPRVEAFAGDFTPEQIDDPDVETPSLGRPGSEPQVEHAAQSDTGEADA